MLTHVAPARAVEEVTVTAPGDLRRTEPLELSHRISHAGEAVVQLGGELDIVQRGGGCQLRHRYYRPPRRPGDCRPIRSCFLRCPRPSSPSTHGRLRRTGGLPIPAGLAQPFTRQNHEDHRPAPQVPDDPVVWPGDSRRATGILLVRGIAAGVCGTDREIAEGAYGMPPSGEGPRPVDGTHRTLGVSAHHIVRALRMGLAKA